MKLGQTKTRFQKASWKKRFFARNGNLLFYFSTDTDVKSLVGVIFLENSTTKESMSAHGQTSCFVVRRMAHGRCDGSVH